MKPAVFPAVLALFVLSTFAVAAEDAKPVPLFDGKTLDGWVTAAGKPVTEGWVVADGAIQRTGKGGDIFTAKDYKDFVLDFEWKIAKAGNSGLKYRFGKYAGGTVGPEYQVLDDAGHPDALIGRQRQAASLYDIVEPNELKSLKPVGEWNTARVVAHGNRIEHWLNGKKVVDVDLSSDTFKKALAKSKFKTSPEFATQAGKIMLQEHGDPVWFRSITIQELSAK